MKYGEEIFQYLFKYNTIRFVVLMSSCIPDNPLENLLSVMSTKRKKQKGMCTLQVITIEMITMPFKSDFSPTASALLIPRPK